MFPTFLLTTFLLVTDKICAYWCLTNNPKGRLNPKSLINVPVYEQKQIHKWINPLWESRAKIQATLCLLSKMTLLPILK